MSRVVNVLLGVGVGLALSPLFVPIRQDVRLSGMAFVFGAVLALAVLDVYRRRGG